ncbi:unnamed protein product [Kuraishia capsulata CBS 1993]|uniref:DNA helicase n=1 Tax=Kuraishia capsulata CBS 1993 TaxID=1382522 RepID=W6MXW3_9ASCO|nr:uncharacterized protein KUCA_T00005578001 [Kuraishia capsulata CBS 1993]CDK29585.1 unnamed protein product [Kuraishia capsulata CBS 1993]
MASSDKFVTIYVLDQSPAMAPHFDQAKAYVESCLVGKILYDHLEEKRPHGRYSVTPGYESLQRFRERVNLNSAPVQEQEGTLVDGVFLALKCISMLLKKDLTTGKLVLPTERLTIVVLTNCESNTGIQTADVELLRTMLRIGNVTLTVVDYGLGKTESSFVKQEQESKWLEFFGRLPSRELDSVFSQRYLMSSIVSGEKVNRATFYWQDAPVTTTYRPVKAFSGEIRLGCDVLKEELVLSDPNAVPQVQNQTIRMNAEGYSLVKKEPPLNASKKVVEKTNEGYYSAGNIKQLKSYYTVESVVNESTGKADKVQREVDSFRIQRRYKFGTSEIPVSDVSRASLKFPTHPAIDVIGFQKKADLPPWYFVHEPLLITHPLPDAGTKSEQLFNVLCQALLDLDYIAIVRFVQKKDTPVEVCAMIPFLLADVRSQAFKGVILNLKRARDDKLETNSLDGSSYCFTLIKLPFREDEMVAVFPRNKSSVDESPSEELLDFMGELVDIQDLDAPNKNFDSKPGREGKYLELQSYPDLTFPEPPFSSNIYNKVTEQLLAQRNPTIEFTSLVLRRLVSEINISGDESHLFDTLLTKSPTLVDQVITKVNEECGPFKPSLSTPAVSLSKERVEHVLALFDNNERPPRETNSRDKYSKNRIVAVDAPPLQL